jgi:hypothetical protein
MADASSPTFARRPVRLVLREAREAAHLSLQEVTDQMEWSLSKAIRIEHDDTSSSPRLTFASCSNISAQRIVRRSTHC